ncbi:phosphocholine-specific phospholipase C [Streptomyces himalayensis]|uniref:phospholipase C n=1 Tax=Streptomyces himalayensis subsp. himalayensis TaxID=2756131 RepID=A0A7W0DNK7_9ACTN|nr:phospholipase C, phosphocholine-specific [Streptomyces himalayensis]MBA2948361.1 phospholipase C, phosphocholine-specific [Streptomyces himalayensis subsp. himalayensis]
MGSDISRRRLLTLGGGALGAAAAGSLLPPSLQAALAAEPPAGGLSAIKHVVILMQENRSFDHYFGMLRGVRGFGDRNAVELPSGKSVFEQPDRKSAVLPFSVRDAAEKQKEDIQYIGDLSHDWETGIQAWHNGWTDQWIPAKTPATMAYYDRSDIPLHYELADTFTICDAYHSSCMTPTSPNRNHLWSGKTGYEPLTGLRAVDNDAYSEDVHPGYDWETYPESLEKAGHSWQTYTEWENFTDNQVEFFATFKAIARKALAKTGGHTYMESFYAAVRDTADQAERDRLLGLLEEGVATLSAQERSLFERGLRRHPTGSLADVFARDVAAGRLPEVSYIVPSAIDSEHPSVSSPIHSASIVYKVLDALASHPEVWRETVVFLNYDENDGFFDHVPPPAPPVDDPDERWEGQPTGLGVRVPMLVISPWTVGGFVCSQVFDHTSVVQFLEKWTGVQEPNISPWRRQVTGDLTAAFDFGGAHEQPAVEQPGPIPPFSGRWSPKPPKTQRMPVQEPGIRPARPLPYQPEACGTVESDQVIVELSNTGSESVHFQLHPYEGEFSEPQHLDVVDRGTWTVPLRSEDYRFTVTGPNGFRREFAGTRAGGADVASTVDGAGRELRLTLTNRKASALTFTIRPGAYVSDADAERLTQHIRVAPGATAAAVHPAAAAQGWYDLLVTVDGDGAFRRRLMGHIENGSASVSG